MRPQERQLADVEGWTASWGGTDSLLKSWQGHILLCAAQDLRIQIRTGRQGVYVRCRCRTMLRNTTAEMPDRAARLAVLHCSTPDATATPLLRSPLYVRRFIVLCTGSEIDECVDGVFRVTQVKLDYVRMSHRMPSRDDRSLLTESKCVDSRAS